MPSLLHSPSPSPCAGHRRRFSALLRLALLGAGMALAAGCATAPDAVSAATALELEVDAAGRVRLGDDAYAVRDLPAALRERHVPLKQSLRIHTPDSDNRALLVRLSSSLRSAGYSRFVFVGDPHAEANVIDPNRPAGARPATPKPAR